MDNLIELLLNNIVFVIIAIGGIISFFKRMSGEEEKQKANPTQKRAQREQSNPHSGGSMQASEIGEDASQSDTVSAYKEALGRMAKRENYGSQNELKVQKNVKSAPYMKDKSLSISKSNVRNGIIWAEILGPPRSRKPHPSMVAVKQRNR
ncbi:hypothetical protein GLW07_06590 [Bacillus hwajinpoensis]|uniref:Uncharacterized protein n=1 Tax=Guptibacillus hwajinpoensis TaxID=208199 RepID=A0A845EWV1_9BACL|nr:hypothetical protein [Pseudalkalibacillus hwajinpoensis]MYL63025.1 hypothetical protein [Pseudalkalibacillus hwajinpoensis]